MFDYQRLFSSPSAHIRYNVAFMINKYHDSHLYDEMEKDEKIKDIIQELKNWPGPEISSHRSANQSFHKLVFLADIGLDKSSNIIEQIEILYWIVLIIIMFPAYKWPLMRNIAGLASLKKLGLYVMHQIYYMPWKEWDFGQKKKVSEWLSFCILETEFRLTTISTWNAIAMVLEVGSPSKKRTNEPIIS